MSYIGFAEESIYNEKDLKTFAKGLPSVTQGDLGVLLDTLISKAVDARASNSLAFRSDNTSSGNTTSGNTSSGSTITSIVVVNTTLIPKPMLEVRSIWNNDIATVPPEPVLYDGHSLRIQFEQPFTPEIIAMNPEIWLFRYSKSRKQIPDVKQSLTDTLSLVTTTITALRSQTTYQNALALGFKSIYETLVARLAKQVPDFGYIPFPTENTFTDWVDTIEARFVTVDTYIAGLPLGAKWKIQKFRWVHPIDKNVRSRFPAFWGGGDSTRTTEWYGDAVKDTLREHAYADIPFRPIEWINQTAIKAKPQKFRFALVLNAPDITDSHTGAIIAGGKGGKFIGPLSDALHVTVNGTMLQYNTNAVKLFSHPSTTTRNIKGGI